MIAEIAMWLERIVSFLPQVITLYEAARTNDPQQELDAAHRLVRAMKNRQAREEIGNA